MLQGLKTGATAGIWVAVCAALGLAGASAHAGLADKAKQAARKLKAGAKDAASAVKKGAEKAASGVKQAAEATADTARSVAFSVQSIANAALYGLPKFKRSVRTEGLDTPGLRAMCPGLIDRVNGCSVPLKDDVTKRFKKHFTGACADHDLCYALTDAKKACDVAFRDRMYRQCDKLSLGKTHGLCKIAAHTWFAAVTHAKLSVKLHAQERQWAREHCKPMPEIATTPIVEPDLTPSR